MASIHDIESVEANKNVDPRLPQSAGTTQQDGPRP